MTEPDLPLAVIQLMKGVVYRDTHERAWRQLLQLQPQVSFPQLQKVSGNNNFKSTVTNVSIGQIRPPV